MRLGPSEFILREDQSAYHLAIHPQDLAETVLLVGDPDRVPLISRYFDRVDVKKSNREFATHTGTLSGKRISVLSTGIGTDNIDIALNELDALVNIDLAKRTVKPQLRSLNLIRIGTCGGLQEDLPADAFVLSEWGLGFDGLLHFYEGSRSGSGILEAFRAHGSKHSWMPEPYAFRAAPELNDRLRSEQVSVGITITQGGFYAPQGRSLRGRLREPGLMETVREFKYGGMRPLNMEMETAAIFGLASLFGHRAASISAVLANRATGTFSDNPRKTVIGLIEYVLERLSTT